MSSPLRRTLVQFRWLLVFALAASIVAALAVVPQPAAAQEGTLWNAEYYNNVTLTGTPAYTTQTPTVGFDWTASAPVPGVNYDNFSARYTSVQNLAGAYTLQVKADDGVRVYINGQLVINQFGVSTGKTYTYQFSVGQGQHIIVVEYYEGGGVAMLSYDLRPLTSPPPPPSTSAQGTVLAWALNVRNAPNAYTGAVLTRVTRGQVLPIVGRNAQGTWWQITANGTTGWVNASYIAAVNTQNVPITDGTTLPTPTSFSATAFLNLNIRSGPGIEYQVVGWLPMHQTAQILGRNAASSWWYVTYGRHTGWISAAYTGVYPAAGTQTIPIVSVTPPAPSVFTAQAVVNLNIRSGPGVGYPVIGWLPMHQSAQIIGRNAVNSWYQLRWGSVTGWSSGSYLSFAAGTDITQIPVTG